MKPTQNIPRVGLAIALGVGLSAAATMLTFNYKTYKGADRAFLFAIPALAIAYLFFISYPALQKIRAFHSSRAHYVVSCFLALITSYGAVGFLDEVLAAPLPTFFFTLISTLILLTGGYALTRRAARLLHRGAFSSAPNILIGLALPTLFTVILNISIQTRMLTWEDVAIPQRLLPSYLAGAAVAGISGIYALNIFHSRKIQRNIFFSFIKENLPGGYAGGMFFLIHLFIARALNRPSLGYNSVLFETDAGPWMNILASPQSDAINRAVHPLTLLIARPLIRLPAIFMGEHWQLAAILVVALLSGSCVFMAYLFIKRATGAETYAFLFAVLLGVTSTHLLFGSLTENYVFGMTALIFFWLLIQSGEDRLFRLVPAGVIVFGITITNIAQTVIGLFFYKHSIAKIARYLAFVLSSAVALTMLTQFIHPDKQTFFFVPADLAFEANFVKAAPESPLAGMKEKAIVATRTMLLYEIIAPEPLVVISQKKNDPFPTIDLKTYDWRDHKIASYKGWANLPLAAWLIFLGGAVLLFFKNLRASKHLPLMMGLLASLGFNFLMHNFYGSELFLYTPYWAYALIFFTALAYAEFANNKTYQTLLAFFVLIVMARNAWFIFFILDALAPFFFSA